MFTGLPVLLTGHPTCLPASLGPGSARFVPAPNPPALPSSSARHRGSNTCQSRSWSFYLCVTVWFSNPFYFHMCFHLIEATEQGRADLTTLTSHTLGNTVPER